MWSGLLAGQAKRDAGEAPGRGIEFYSPNMPPSDASRLLHGVQCKRWDVAQADGFARTLLAEFVGSIPDRLFDVLRLGSNVDWRRKMKRSTVDI